MKPFLAAVRFLTILPVPGSWGTAEDDLARSVLWFPVIGLLLGAAAAGIVWLLAWAAPPLVLAALTVSLLLSFSGCLHLDGLADTADGFLSSRPRERILEIMKDSHVGVMGVAAIVCVLLVKFAALAALAQQATAKLWPVVLLMPLAGRAAIVVQLALLPYARPGGTALIFYRGPRRLAAVWAMSLLALVSWVLLGLSGLIVWAACLAVTLIFSAFTYRKIGGATGDTFGAICELCEVVPVLIMALTSCTQA